MLRDQLGKHVQRYGMQASELDRTLFTRILSRRVAEDVSDDELRARYEAMLTKRKAVVAAGILPEGAWQDIGFPSTLDPLEKHVICIYLDDMEAKLNVFDGFVERVQLFTSMITGMFKFKGITIGTDYGFRFRSEEGRTLPPEALSSGEQHQLVLLFDLLFVVPQSALILVDEPEISLHVEWQQQVLANFRSVSQLRDLDFVIATHSPDIIHNHWDLTVALEEQKHA
jgi:hypothetical protein